MARKEKVVNEAESYDTSHVYKCLRCGIEWENPIGHFYISRWSELYIKNSKFVPLCKTCVNEMFGKYEKKYGTEMACIIMCYKLDIPYYYSLYDSITKNNNIFSMGLMLRQLNNRQYQYQDFSQSILTKEVGKTKSEYDLQKETKWLVSDIQKRDNTIDIYGYDPFDGYPEEDRKFLFNQLAPYLEDDDISSDTYKLSQLLQIVNNNKQIRECDIRLTALNPIRDANDIKTLNEIKRTLVSNNDKIAKENEISVKNRTNKDVGKSTLTGLMRNMREKNLADIEEDYYAQLTSAGTMWAINMSTKSILEHTFFDENDKKEIYETQLKLVTDLYKEVDVLKEKIRILTIENGELTKKLKDGDTNS